MRFILAMRKLAKTMNTVRLIPKIFVRLLIWIIPMNLLDGCLNRDPYLKIDHRFSILAICGSCPLNLINRDKSQKWDWNDQENNPFKTFEEFEAATDWRLESVTQIKLSDEVIIGDSPKGSFIADRKTGKLNLLQSQSARDYVLKHDYSLDLDNDIHPPTEWMWIRSRLFWPWFLSYYIGCLLLLPPHTIREEYKRSRPGQATTG